MSKSLFIRCSEETHNLEKALAKKVNRSLNQQIIHMIHTLADDLDVIVEQEPVGASEKKSDTKCGLTKLVETKSQAS